MMYYNKEKMKAFTEYVCGHITWPAYAEELRREFKSAVHNYGYFLCNLTEKKASKLFAELTTCQNKHRYAFAKIKLEKFIYDGLLKFNLKEL
jgi:hypothetical protein